MGAWLMKDSAASGLPLVPETMEGPPVPVRPVRSPDPPAADLTSTRACGSASGPRGSCFQSSEPIWGKQIGTSLSVSFLSISQTRLHPHGTGPSVPAGSFKAEKTGERGRGMLCEDSARVAASEGGKRGHAPRNAARPPEGNAALLAP